MYSLASLLKSHLRENQTHTFIKSLRQSIKSLLEFITVKWATKITLLITGPNRDPLRIPVVLNCPNLFKLYQTSHLLAVTRYTTHPTCAQNGAAESQFKQNDVFFLMLSCFKMPASKNSNQVRALHRSAKGKISGLLTRFVFWSWTWTHCGVPTSWLFQPFSCITSCFQRMWCVIWTKSLVRAQVLQQIGDDSKLTYLLESS